MIAADMTHGDLLRFLRSHRYAVQASVTPAAAPQAAVVGIAVSDDLEIVFDTIASSRKAVNLAANPRIAFVIGGTNDGDERTVQYEGVADVPTGAEGEAIRERYFAVFADGRDRLQWKGLIHIRVRPVWIRYSDFSASPPVIEEFVFRDGEDGGNGSQEQRR